MWFSWISWHHPCRQTSSDSTWWSLCCQMALISVSISKTGSKHPSIHPCNWNNINWVVLGKKNNWAIQNWNMGHKKGKNSFWRLQWLCASPWKYLQVKCCLSFITDVLISLTFSIMETFHVHSLSEKVEHNNCGIAEKTYLLFNLARVMLKIEIFDLTLLFAWTAHNFSSVWLFLWETFVSWSRTAHSSINKSINKKSHSVISTVKFLVFYLYLNKLTECCLEAEVVLLSVCCRWKMHIGQLN